MEPVNSLGRRKTSIARIVLTEGSGEITVNGRDSKEYFPVTMQQFKLQQPFKLTASAAVSAGFLVIGREGAGERRA